MRFGNKPAWWPAVLAAGSCLGFPAHAGGHFDVDDAPMLAPGQCQVEAWGGHATRESIEFVHLGPACRTGPVELGLNLDLAQAPGQRIDLLGPQLKWTFLGQEPDAALAMALSFGAFQDVRQGGRWGGQWVVPLTWQVAEPLALHVNLGLDWAPGSGTRSTRGGLGLEWSLQPQLSLLAERNRAFQLWTTRVGLRFQLTASTSLEGSVARIGTQGVRLFTIGLARSFSP